MIENFHKKIILIIVFSYLLFNQVKNDDYKSMLILSFTIITVSYIFLKPKKVYEGIDNSVQFTEEEEEARRQRFNPEEETEETDTTAATSGSTTETTDNIPAASNTPFVSAEYVRLREEARKKEGPSGPTEITNNESPEGEGNEEKEPINKFRMGPYDGLCISSDKFMENNLISNENLVTYFGFQIPQQHVSSQDILKGPTIDGKKDSPQKLTMFANNKTSINCCGESPYMTSTGCVCLTENQRRFIQSRGFNKTEGDI